MRNSIDLGAFPPETFSRLAGAKISCQRFLVENAALGIAELGIGKLRCDNNAARKFFSMDFDAATTKATTPLWQISLREGAAFVVRNLDAGENLHNNDARAEFEALLSSATDPREKIPPISSPTEVGGEWYLPAARRIVAKIEAGELQKLVLARALDLTSNAEIPTTPILKKLRERFQKNCTIFSFSDNGETFIGASPEMLVRLVAGNLATEALAGSLANAKTADAVALATKLRNNGKERREHAIVVGFVAEKLRSLGMSPEAPATPDVVVLPNILHLRTAITAKAPAGTHILDVATALHPTPAMCGTPVKIARDTILATEPFSRGKFAGPLGFFDGNGEGFLAVGIRCALIRGNKIRLYAGSGLVSGSVPEKEFLETENKFSAVLDHLGS
ncbi:MAG: isochorismate synthase [Opitutae bacterium]|nr:isochorismate synthase [Opitutae bacterium]